MDVALEIKELSKKYKNFNAIDKISFKVNTGDFFALIGPNGAGKTTIISCIAGLIDYSGKINIFGKNAKNNRSYAKLNVGIVPQEITYDPFLNVNEILNFQSGYFGLINNQDWIDEILENIGLVNKKYTNTRNLSGGMKRRLMLAQALVHKPKIIILDEPTAGVDIELRYKLWDFISNLNKKGHTIILTTHYLEEVEQLCNKLAIIKNGKILITDETNNINNDNQIKLSIKLDKEIPIILNKFILTKETNHSYIIKLDNFNQLSNILKIVNDMEINIKEMNFIENNLNEFFLRLIKEKK